MNKKNLSVVMAGAMLATSVAPVLAATNTEMPVSQTDLIINGLEKILESEKIASASELTELNTNGILSEDLATAANSTQGSSVYGIELVDAKGNVVQINGRPRVYKVSDLTNSSNGLAKVLASVSDVEGYKINVYKRNTVKFLGLNLPTTNPEVKKSAEKYTADDLTKIKSVINDTKWVDGSQSGTTAGDSVESTTYPGLFAKDSSNVKLNKYIVAGSADLSTDGKTLTFKVKALDSLNDSNSNKTVSISVDGKQLNFNAPINKDNELVSATDNVQDCVGFLAADEYVASVKELTETLEQTITLKNDTKEEDKNEYYLASDLYDGFALTAKGTEILNDLNSENEDVTVAIVKSGSDITANEKLGIYTFKVTYTEEGEVTKTIVVNTTNEAEKDALLGLLEGTGFNVGIIGGANRYETAVNVAKENTKALQITTKDDTYNAHIVLVNGTSLVDGLAAAPLASVVNKSDNGATASTTTAPVLLSETDKLPTATKEYIEEITKGIAPADRTKVTIDLVGGTGVLSTTLEKELKNMGFSVARYGGNDREDTSVAVAQKVVASDDTSTEMFVVGGNGEADAMSISAYAAKKGAPIIVSSVHGLTDNAINFAKYNFTTTGDSITIVGGDKVVTKEEFKKLNALDTTTNDITVERVAGDTRFETNAKIIEKYYATDKTKSVVLVKDGQSNKSELVDALSAANYAASLEAGNSGAPIILASNKLSDAQKNTLLKVKAPDTSDGKVAQVGIGVEKSVLETIADLFDISNL